MRYLTRRKLSCQGHQESLEAARESRRRHDSVHRRAPQAHVRTRNRLWRGADWYIVRVLQGRRRPDPLEARLRHRSVDSTAKVIGTRSRATTRPSPLSSDDAASERDSCEGRQQAHRTPRRGDDLERLRTRTRVHRQTIRRRDRRPPRRINPGSAQESESDEPCNVHSCCELSPVTQVQLPSHRDEQRF